MGYLEAPLSLNPSDREPKTTIVTRVMLETVLTTAAELALPRGPAVLVTQDPSRTSPPLLANDADNFRSDGPPSIGNAKEMTAPWESAGNRQCVSSP
jgi:hypothetical protein